MANGQRINTEWIEHGSGLRMNGKLTDTKQRMDGTWNRTENELQMDRGLTQNGWSMEVD